MSLSQILLNTQSYDDRVRIEAEKYLAESKAQNLGLFLTTLTEELVDEGKDLRTRTAAGIIIKNTLSSSNETIRHGQEKNWLNLDPDIRDNIKNGILRTLESPLASSTAAQVCACVAQIELPKNLWPQLIDILLQNAHSSNANLKKGTLQSIGYICEDLNPAVVASKTSEILTAVVPNMREEEVNVEVKYAATTALENALDFAKENFKRVVERDYIMSVIIQGALGSQSVQVKVAGYGCLVKIASLYYEYLPAYMQVLFNLTIDSIKKDPQEVALQAIEFWSTICDEEIYLLQEIEEALIYEMQPTVVCHNFVKGAMQFLLPVLFETLTKQDEDADEDQWDISMAGATCLTQIANCVHNDIAEPVMNFVRTNLTSPDWRLREAAAMAFGSILEGIYNFNDTITQVLPYLITYMQSDTSPFVKDTAAWSIGRICQLHPSAIRGDVINLIMKPLLAALNDSPRVAANVCWALNNIAETFRDASSRPADNFKPYFEYSVMGLLDAAERPDAYESNLKAAAYEAINEFIQSAENEECKQMVKALVPVFQSRLENTFKVQAISQDDRDHIAESQGLLASLLQTCTIKLDKDIKPHADACAELYIKVLNTKSTTVQEEALMAFGALANALEADFAKYMVHFHPFLLLGLQTYESCDVCSISVGVVADVCRALQKLIAPYCFEIISILISHLQNAALNKNVKPMILSCFGDIALAIGGSEFTKYLLPTVNILFQAANYQVDKNNEELVDYQNSLREGIFEAFAGILQGLRVDNEADAFLPFAESLVAFVTDVIFQDQTRSEAVTRGAIGVLGDLAHSLHRKVLPLLQQDSVKRILFQCLRDCESDSPTYDVAYWSQEVIAKLNNL